MRQTECSSLHCRPVAAISARQWSDKIPYVCHCLQVCTRNGTWLSVRAVPISFCTSRTTSPAFCYGRGPPWSSSCQTCHLWKAVVCLRWPICLKLTTWRVKRYMPQPFSFYRATLCVSAVLSCCRPPVSVGGSVRHVRLVAKYFMRFNLVVVWISGKTEYRIQSCVCVLI